VLRATVAIASMVVLTGRLVAVGSAEAASARIDYSAWPNPESLSMCVGDSTPIHVRIQRVITVNGTGYDSWVSGGVINGTVQYDSVGRLEPADTARPVGGPPEMDAIYEFVATGPGRTGVTFTIYQTGEDQRVGWGSSRHNDTVAVEVKDCFDAYTSGLGTVFDMKDMGALDKPFHLEGHINQNNLEGATQRMQFMPDPQNRTTGEYEFVDTSWAQTGPSGKCTAYVSGRYDVVFYPDAVNPVEGDLLMKGTGAVWCAGYKYDIDYTSTPGFQIGFKPRPAPPPPPP
jgi:hypothetical protein